MIELCNEPLSSDTSKFCDKHANSTVEGYHKKVCGIHKKTVEKKLASGQAINKNLTTKTMSKKTTTITASAPAKSSSEPEKTQTMTDFVNDTLNYVGTDTAVKKIKSQPVLIINTIRKAIEDNNPLLSKLTESDRQVINSLPIETDRKAFEIIIANAYKISNSTQKKIDYCSIAHNIVPSYYGYQKAISVEKKPVKTEILFFKRRTNTEKDILMYEVESDKDLPYKKIDFGGSTMLQIHFSDVNVKICNCKFVDIEEWSKDTNNIYMGPSFGFHYFDNSEWFIPFQRNNFMNREEQNKFDVNNILKKIKEGNETKEKYLNLKGKTLGCICMPNFCHCEVYVDVIRNLSKTEN